MYDDGAGAVSGASACAPCTDPTLAAGALGVGADALATKVEARAEAALAADPVPAAHSYIDRDPSVNKSLLLRLIAGVRGL